MVPGAFWGIFAFLFGAIVGSFLNVVIWRLPRGESLVFPGSHCPHCGRLLAAYENIPLISFLALRAKCRTCHKPISWRYFCVEFLTAALFVALCMNFGPSITTVAYCLFASALIAAFFIDWELFIIPDEVNAFALLVGIGLDIARLIAQEPGYSLLWGWLPRSIAGAMVCAAVFVGIQVLGKALFKKEAMGDGDVKLARAIGSMLPLGQALVSFLLAIGAGALLGGAMIAFSSLRAANSGSESVSNVGDEEVDEPSPLPMSLTLLFGAIYITFLDILLPIASALRLPGAKRLLDSLESSLPPEEEEDDFVAGPRHIPFGPYMVVGALASVFIGDRLIHWYLVWARIAPVG